MRRLTWLVAVGFLLCASSSKAEEQRSSWLARIAQLAPDGFPLRFPERTPTAPAVQTAPEELPAPPQAVVVPQQRPLPAPVVPVRYMTHREFAATFRPLPGNYEVMMIHPYTRCPVKVCFSLPPGCIREVDADRNELRFDYGSWELEVHFKRDGRVLLDIDD